MKKLRLEALAVESFSTGDEPAAQPGISDGFECNQTLYLTCGTCKCHTVRYDCV